MNATLGTVGTVVGLAGALLGATSMLLGLLRKQPQFLRMGHAYAWLVLAGAVLATIAMQSALIGHDFSLTYVAKNGSRSTPLFYTVASMWGALEGSIILWALVLSGYLIAVVRRFRQRLDDPLVGWALLVVFAVAAFFFALMLGPANPFTVVSGTVPLDGPGPNPLLQNHVLMAIHPPFLYLGYVGFTIPFAFAIAALITGRSGEGWLIATRRWTLVAWGCLTVGIILGSWWSYEVLGWGGYWAWDPVENASFLPWLTGTAFLHSVVIQERRAMLRVWNLSLIISTFALTILGTFLTRSGVLDSVHSFTESPIGPWLLSLFAVVVITGVGLIAWRGDSLRSEGTIESPLSREGLFLANNVAFASFAFVVLLGTVFPLLYEAFRGEQISVGAPYFNRMTMPVGMTLLFLMAVAPLLPWRKTTGELLRARLFWPSVAATAGIAVPVLFGARGLAPVIAFGLGAMAATAALRNIATSARGLRREGRSVLLCLVGRSNGGMVVHLGVVVLAVAFAASSSYTKSSQVRLEEGSSARVAGHVVEYLGMNEPKVTRQKTVTSARIRVDGGQVWEPALNQFPNATQTIPTPSVRSGVVDDVYLILVAPPTKDGGSALIKVIVGPLVMWLWLGGAIMAIGCLLSAWPTSRRNIGRQEMEPGDRAEDKAGSTSATVDEIAPSLVAP